MYDYSYPKDKELVQTFYYQGGSNSNGASSFPFTKPKGCRMAHIILVGAGGQGGTGAVGANSTAAGGGGGGSGGQSVLLIDLGLLPNTIYLSLTNGGVGTPHASRIMIAPNGINALDTVLTVNAGANGGNASGATAGTGATATSAALLTNCPLAGLGHYVFYAGQAGGAGGAAVAAAAVSLPTSGLIVTAGAGGGGLPAAAAVGTLGGKISGSGSFPTTISIPAASTATTPPGNANHGYQPLPPIPFYYGGNGGGSTHGSATGAGLVQARGGNGAPGCGGGGNGGALTGTTALTAGGLGGPSFCIIRCW